MPRRSSQTSSTDRENALIEQALAELRQKRIPGANNRPPMPPLRLAGKASDAALRPAPLPALPALPEAPMSLSSTDIERTIKIPILIRRKPAAPVPAATAKHTVFSPAGMHPELATKIALLMEQEADAREEKRVKQRRMVVIWAGAGLVLLFGALGLGLMSSPPPGVKSTRPSAPQVYDTGPPALPATQPTTPAAQAAAMQLPAPQPPAVQLPMSPVPGQSAQAE